MSLADKSPRLPLTEIWFRLLPPLQSARRRTQRSLAIGVKQGQYRVEEVREDDNGRTIAAGLTAYGTADETIAFLNSMEWGSL